MAELNRAYPDGILRVDGNYSSFWRRKKSFCTRRRSGRRRWRTACTPRSSGCGAGPRRARQSRRRASTRRETDRRAGRPESHERGPATAQIDFSATDRQTKRLIELENVGYDIGGRTLFDNLNFMVTAGMRVGLVGPNGSGKTTLLRLLRGELEPTAGEIRRADWLRIVYFDQNRELDPECDAAAGAGARQRFGDLSGPRDSRGVVGGAISVYRRAAEPAGGAAFGRRAGAGADRAADAAAGRCVLLDEPTNDLDIPTLEILEESLLEFRGALVLVTHDRYMLDRVSTVVLGSRWSGRRGALRRLLAVGSVAGGSGHARECESDSVGGPRTARRDLRPAKKKLSYLEAREYAAIEQRVAEAEECGASQTRAAGRSGHCQRCGAIDGRSCELEQAQQVVDALYARWAELEKKQA